MLSMDEGRRTAWAYLYAGPRGPLFMAPSFRHTGHRTAGLAKGHRVFELNVSMHAYSHGTRIGGQSLHSPDPSPDGLHRPASETLVCSASVLIGNKVSMYKGLL